MTFFIRNAPSGAKSGPRAVTNDFIIIDIQRNNQAVVRRQVDELVVKTIWSDPLSVTVVPDASMNIYCWNSR